MVGALVTKGPCSYAHVQYQYVSYLVRNAMTLLIVLEASSHACFAMTRRRSIPTLQRQQGDIGVVIATNKRTEYLV